MLPPVAWWRYLGCLIVLKSFRNNCLYPEKKSRNFHFTYCIIILHNFLLVLVKKMNFEAFTISHILPNFIYFCTISHIFAQILLRNFTHFAQFYIPLLQFIAYHINLGRSFSTSLWISSEDFKMFNICWFVKLRPDVNMKI